MSNSQTITVHDDVTDLETDKSMKTNPVSLPEFDSGLSENESSSTKRTDLMLSKMNNIPPLAAPSSSDVESGFSGDYSPYGQTSSSLLNLAHQSSIDTNDTPTIERIALELNSIAIDWRSYHAPVNCSCSLPFDSVQRKVCHFNGNFSSLSLLTNFFFCFSV